MDKVIRDGKVAVLVSDGYGAGWSTWVWSEYRETYLFHPKLVQMVEEGRKLEITPQWIEKETGIKPCPGAYTAGSDGLHIVWVPVGTKFVIHVYDGNETLKTINDYNWITA